MVTGLQPMSVMVYRIYNYSYNATCSLDEAEMSQKHKGSLSVDKQPSQQPDREEKAPMSPCRPPARGWAPGFS